MKETEWVAGLIERIEVELRGYNENIRVVDEKNFLILVKYFAILTTNHRSTILWNMKQTFLFTNV